MIIMILIASFILLTAYAIGCATLGTDYLKWFFLGVNYQSNDIKHKQRDERDKIIGTLILLMVNIIIIIIAFVL